ncbi:hypothetical protein D3C71_841530 [compost metagenome]|jgi:hypothetical protein
MTTHYLSARSLPPLNDFIKPADANSGIHVGITLAETRQVEKPAPERGVTEGNELCYDDHQSTSDGIHKLSKYN